MQGPEAKKQLEYWSRKLGDAPIATNLPTDYRRPRTSAAAGHALRTTLSRELSDALLQLSRNQGATAYMTLMAAFLVVVSK